jgi:hypothetical protein
MEEYATVIAFGVLSGMVPNWRYLNDTIKCRPIVFKLLYVLCMCFFREVRKIYI